MEKQEQDTTEEQKAPIPLPTKLGMIALPMVPAVFIDLLTNGGITPPVLAAFGLSYVAFDRSPKVCAWLGKNRAFLSYLSTHPDTLKNFDRLTNGYFSRQLGESNDPKDAIDTPDRIAQLTTMPYGDYLQTPEWKDRTKRIRARDGHACSDCGRADVPLDVHHLTYERRGHERDEDLITLCRACHDARHGNVPKAELPQSRQVPAQGFGEDDLKSLETIIQQSDTTLPGRCDFSTTLRTFTPTRERIFLGYLPGGQPVYVTLEDLCHVALGGLTGNGKSTLMRLLVSQLEYVGAKVLILNPHYTSYDIKKHEDWTPIERHLYHPPVTDFAAISGTMRWVATDLLRGRLAKYRASEAWGDPLFVVIDELPAIVKYDPDFPEYVSAILREGRKVDVLLIAASQDFEVKTIGPDEGGAVRKNFKTKMYVGGDVTTAKVLLDMPASQVPEQQLGEGVIMMRNQAVKKASIARVPYVDNAALYTLLGPSTYAPGTAEQAEDDLVDYLVNGNRTSERDTDPVQSAQTARYTSGVRPRRDVAAIKQAREQRLRGVHPSAVQDDELARGIKAYRSGARALDAFCAAMGYQKINQGRLLWAQVKLKVQEDV